MSPIPDISTHVTTCQASQMKLLRSSRKERCRVCGDDAQFEHNENTVVEYYCSILHYSSSAIPSFDVDFSVNEVSIVRKARLAIQINEHTLSNLIHRIDTGPLTKLHLEFEESHLFAEKFSFKAIINETKKTTVYKPYAIPPLFESAPPIYVNASTIIDLIDFLDAPFEKIHSLIKYVNILNVAIEKKDFAYYAKYEGTQWVYRCNDYLYAQLLLTVDEKTRLMCEMMMTEYMAQYQRRVQIDSLQSYVCEKLSTLRREESTSWLPEISFAVPSRNNEIWSVLLDNYADGHTSCYSIYRVGEHDRISIVAHHKTSRHILGYITCSLHQVDTDISSKSDLEYTIDMDLYRFFDQDHTNCLFKCFSIDALHISPSRRGGKENSLAVMLVFQVLHFIRESAKELGVSLLCCYSLARSTMLIMRQFGFVYVNAKQSLRWMKERIRERLRKISALERRLYAYDTDVTERRQLQLEKEAEEIRRPIDIDLSYYVHQFEPDLISSVGVMRDDVLLGLLENRYNKTPDVYDATRHYVKDRFEHKWDTFLYMNTKNHTFDKEMLRCTNLFSTSIHKRAPAEELPVERTMKRRRLDDHQFY